MKSFCQRIGAVVIFNFSLVADTPRCGLFCQSPEETGRGTSARKSLSNPFVLFPSTVTVHPELVEGWGAKLFMLLQAQHERLILQVPYNCGRISKERAEKKGFYFESEEWEDSDFSSAGIMLPAALSRSSRRASFIFFLSLSANPSNIFQWDFMARALSWFRMACKKV